MKVVAKCIVTPSTLIGSVYVADESNRMTCSCILRRSSMGQRMVSMTGVSEPHIINPTGTVTAPVQMP